MSLASHLLRQPELLLLDEPTNHLDIETIDWLEQYLAGYSGAVILVSHDRYFLDRICDQIVAFEDDGVKVSPGNFSYYLEKRQARENAARAQATAANRQAKKRTATKKDKPRKLTLAEAEELKTLEDKVMASDKAVTALQEKLSSPEVQTDFAPHKVMAEL